MGDADKFIGFQAVELYRIRVEVLQPLLERLGTLQRICNFQVSGLRCIYQGIPQPKRNLSDHPVHTYRNDMAVAETLASLFEGLPKQHLDRTTSLAPALIQSIEASFADISKAYGQVFEIARNYSNAIREKIGLPDEQGSETRTGYVYYDYLAVFILDMQLGCRPNHDILKAEARRVMVGSHYSAECDEPTCKRIVEVCEDLFSKTDGVEAARPVLTKVSASIGPLMRKLENLIQETERLPGAIVEVQTPISPQSDVFSAFGGLTQSAPTPQLMVMPSATGSKVDPSQLKLDANITLTEAEINKVVHKYIGVHGGYLGDFSYSSHQQFYYDECNLSHIVTNDYQGTTRARFIAILREQKPDIQARILQGVLKRFTVQNAPDDSTWQSREESLPFMQSLISRLEQRGGSLELRSPESSSATVKHALADARLLLRESGPANAVDRVHTALHGHLFQICEEAGIEHGNDLEITGLLKLIRKNHVAFSNLSPEIERILGAFATIVDAFNPVRNRKTLAHPNKALLEDAEASLVIGAASSLLSYLEAKLGA